MSVPQCVPTPTGTATLPNPGTAWIPYRVVGGTPRNPFASTGAAARGKPRKHVGERKCVDAVVYCTVNGQEYILLGERADGLGWAFPGGGLEGGERIRDGVSRELFEETGVWVEPDLWQLGQPQYVPDPRADDEHWYVTVLATVHLGERDELPATVCVSDIRRTAWFRRGTYVGLLAELDERFGGVEFSAHRFMLAAQFQHDVADAA